MPTCSGSTKTHRQRREMLRLQAQLAALDRHLSRRVSANAAAPAPDVAGFARQRYRLFSALQRGVPGSENDTADALWARAVTQNENLATLARRA